jgi:hypothetical protein
MSLSNMEEPASDAIRMLYAVDVEFWIAVGRAARVGISAVIAIRIFNGEGTATAKLARNGSRRTIMRATL